MRPSHTRHPAFLTGGTLVLALAASVFGQEKPYTQPGTGQPPPLPTPPKPAATSDAATAPATPSKEPGGLEKFFDGRIPEAITKGKFNLNVRLRYEYVDQSNLPEVSNAPTLRTRFGYTTAPLYGFTGMIEGENVTAIGSVNNYNAAGSNGQATKPVVADPPTTELNQVWLGYNYTNQVSAKIGRQRIALDNHRFIGDVGWRQNMQTFDAFGGTWSPLKELSLYYGYVWDVHRVFGDVSGLPPTSANRDFESASHLINVSYTPCKEARIVGYAYLLDLDLMNGTATQFDNSCATYGGYIAGSTAVSERFSVGYRGELAFQTEYGSSALDYDALYYNVELSGNVKPFAFGAGYEVLGSGADASAPGTRVGFKTPLATGHAFNGWADALLTTPNAGLRDLYGFIQYTLPGQLPLRFVYHKFDAETGGADFGQEFDVILSRKLGKHWNALVKYAYYDGVAAAPPALAAPNIDLHKFWAQIEFNY